MRSALVLASSALLLAAGLPAVNATHLSVGWSDAVGMEPAESPEDPSVTEEDYRVGTSRDCYEPNPENRSLEEIEQARSSDAFCGELVYHEGTAFENVADPDQQLNGPIGEFDVVRGSELMSGTGTCLPTWCTAPVLGDTTFETLHDVGAVLGLTEDGSHAGQKDGDRNQVYGAELTVPAAAQVVQEGTDAWRMNGWYQHQPLRETFVGFLYDKAGDPVDDDRLQEIVAANRGQLPSDRPIENTVCGFRDTSFVYTYGILSLHYTPGEEGWCQLYFEWLGPSENEDGFRDGYEDRCRATAYVCGALQPAWRAKFACPEHDGCTDSGTSSTDVDYSVWHWFVAPSRSECNGQQLPGAAFDTDATWDYLAHDLDVWTPITSLSGVENTESVHHLRNYAQAAAGALAADAQGAALENVSRVLSELDEQTTPILEDAEDRAEDILSAPGLPDVPSAPVVLKSSRVEPNHARDDLDALEFTEDSQIKQWSREDAPDATSCAGMFGDTEEHVDPWVNIVDMDTIEQRTTSGVFTLAGPPALYGNDAEHQDSVNRPTTSPAAFSGKIGVFADKDDSGAYDTRPFEHLAAIEEGAYPLFWDMRLDENGKIDTNRGCELEDGQGLVDAMQAAHYGPRTGLVIAVYLQEPTAVFDDFGQNVITAEGESIVLFESQSVATLRDLGDPHAEDLVERITEGLRGHPDIPDDAGVISVTGNVSADSAFRDQCNEQTGGFTTDYSVLHHCETGCEGDTIVTGYMVESTHSKLEIGSREGGIPTLEFLNGEVFYLDGPIETWLDVDPFDGDPDRNREDSSAPPH